MDNAIILPSIFILNLTFSWGQLLPFNLEFKFGGMKKEKECISVKLSPHPPF